MATDVNDILEYDCRLEKVSADDYTTLQYRLLDKILLGTEFELAQFSLMLLCENGAKYYIIYTLIAVVYNLHVGEPI